MRPRAILHVDMDAFYASVEQLDDPALRDRPVLVGWDGPRGVVAAASYEARRFGCHSAQPISAAKRSCPQAVIVPARFSRYRELSKQVFAILNDVTPAVQPLSIDEAFLDVTGSKRLLGDPVSIAHGIKARIRDDTGLTASVGVAWNMFLAKIASDWSKPDGLTVLEPSDLETRIAALPIRTMWGVGPATAARLEARGVRTFADIQRMPIDEVRRRLGDQGEHFWRLARGEDGRRVSADGRSKSISSERTFGTDLTSPEHVRQVMLGQSELVAERVRRSGLVARTIVVKIRDGRFCTVTRSDTLEQATDETEIIWTHARSLFDAWASRDFRPVRLIGVGATNLREADGEQLDLFADDASRRRRAIDEATDTIRARFGSSSIGRGIDDRPSDASRRPGG